MMLSELYARTRYHLAGRVVHLTPHTPIRGSVLFSYTTLPFMRPLETLTGHTLYWEAHEMASLFLERGYRVDVIDATNHTYRPRRAYDFFIDNDRNIERLAPLLPSSCIKVLHITTAHWRYQNAAAQARAEALTKRRGVVVAPDRQLTPSRGIEICDIATVLGNTFTSETYAFANKPIVRIPISTTHRFAAPDHKDMAVARKQFLWFGGAGLLHKGLDLVLEAFARMPEFQLVVCGKIQPTDELAKVYAAQLYHSPTTTVLGFIDPGSKQFQDVCDATLGIVYPSCSEGGGGSVVLAMHAGLIPIVTKEASVDVGDFGVVLPDAQIETIMREVRSLAAEDPATLSHRTQAAWHCANTHHTKEAFSAAYRTFIDTLEQRRQPV